jgi:hypothetical protein
MWFGENARSFLTRPTTSPTPHSSPMGNAAAPLLLVILSGLPQKKCHFSICIDPVVHGVRDSLSLQPEARAGRSDRRSVQFAFWPGWPIGKTVDLGTYASAAKSLRIDASVVLPPMRLSAPAMPPIDVPLMIR